MKKNLIFGIAGTVLLVGGAGAYLALTPSPQGKEATAAIKAGNYEDAVRLANRGSVDQSGNRR